MPDVPLDKGNKIDLIYHLSIIFYCFFQEGTT